MKKPIILILLNVILTISFSTKSIAQIQIGNFSPEHIPTGFHAVTAENDVIIVTFPEEGDIWKSHCYNTDGSVKWETDLQIEENEYVIQDELYNGVLNVFSTVWDKKSKKAILRIRQLDENNGELLSQKVLWEKNVSKEDFNYDKADVIADEEMALIARRDEAVEVHLEYRYNMHISKENSTFLFYIYDYSGEHLSLSYKIFNQNVKEIKFDSIEFMDGQLIYEVKVNDKGDVFVANANLEGDLEVRKYPLDSGDVQLINILAESRQMTDIKDDLSMNFIDDNKLMIACKTEFDEIFLGIIYALFDFENNRVDRERFQPINIELLHLVDSLRKAKIIRQVVWNKYNLTHFNYFENGDLLFVFEHMDIKHSGHIFREIDFVSQLPWKKHKSVISVGPVLMFSFSDQDVLKWSKYFNVELQTDEDVFPLSSMMHIKDPTDDAIAFLVRENEGSYEYVVEYSGDKTEEKIPFEEKGKLIPAWTVEMNGDYYISIYSEEDKTLVIRKML